MKLQVSVSRNYFMKFDRLSIGAAQHSNAYAPEMVNDHREASHFSECCCFVRVIVRLLASIRINANLIKFNWEDAMRTERETESGW